MNCGELESGNGDADNFEPNSQTAVRTFTSRFDPLTLTRDNGSEKQKREEYPPVVTPGVSGRPSKNKQNK